MDCISFNRPTYIGTENAYIAAAVRQDRISGDGPFTEKCRRLLEAETGARRVFLTTSCTHALEMSALLLDLGPGDEVIVPSFTFVSTANAFTLRGAVPRFIDIRPDTLNIDPDLLEGAITSRTKALVPIHYAGVAAEMDKIMNIARQYRLHVVEDNAHGLFGAYRGKALGTIGTFGTLSFHETKNFTCGEGGALLINDEHFIERAEIIREKGTNRSRFFRGQVDKYTWVDIGSSYLLSDILAAFLWAQLEARKQVQEARRHIWETYHQELAGWAVAQGVQLPVVPSDCEQPYHLFHMIMPDERSRDAFIAYLRKHKIPSAFHYLPLHLSTMGRRFGGSKGDCPVTEDICDRLVRLPFYTGLGESKQKYVISVSKEFIV